mmetsp:Transcript_30799/g.46720  ORF Transcript_30799/g.46720 Transcript_30799/m.46720 type:complete len:297 (-) Transcript_30799:70-960(-)
MENNTLILNARETAFDHKQIAALQQECDRLKDQLHRRDREIKMFERERLELQGGLDKTMQELAKADQELRYQSFGNGSSTSQHLSDLYIWIMNQYNTEQQYPISMPTNAGVLVEEIKKVIESSALMNKSQKGCQEEQEHLSARDKRDVARQRLQQLLSNVSSRSNNTPNGTEQIYSNQLAQKELEIHKLQVELNQVRRMASNASSNTSVNSGTMTTFIEGVEVSKTHEQRDIELWKLKKELQEKTESERTLNESLAEALHLLKPLQSHLQTAEKEKKALAKELKRTRKQITKLRMV